MRCLTGENYETEFPKDADMKPPGGLIPSWRPVLQFDINLCKELEKYGDHE
jgi:hypothetical protein